MLILKDRTVTLLQATVLYCCVATADSVSVPGRFLLFFLLKMLCVPTLAEM